MLALGLAAALLLGCASESKHREAELDRIEQWLPGRYDNRAQTQDARQAGGTVPAALALTIEPTDALLLGRHVFFAEEAADDGSERILGQRLLSFEIIEGQIVATVWVLTDPQRWRAARTSPELFTSLQPPDVRQVRGCNLTWKKGTEQFTGSTDRLRCRTPLFGSGGATFVETQVGLTSDDLSINDRRFDGHGKRLDAGDAVTLVRFLHSGG